VRFRTVRDISSITVGFGYVLIDMYHTCVCNIGEWTKAAAICREYADVDASFGIDKRSIQDLAEISEVMAADLFNQFSPNQHK
jgi:hypothetical protein